MGLEKRFFLARLPCFFAAKRVLPQGAVDGHIVLQCATADQAWREPCERSDLAPTSKPLRRGDRSGSMASAC